VSRCVHVGRIEAQCRPLTLGQFAIADDMLVEARRLVGRVRGERLGRRPLAGMDQNLERLDLAPLAGEGA